MLQSHCLFEQKRKLKMDEIERESSILFESISYWFVYLLNALS